jgi:hypothetical protein
MSRRRADRNRDSERAELAVWFHPKRGGLITKSSVLAARDGSRAELVGVEL